MSGEAAAEPGRREQNKLDKAERIRAAASSLFKTHGYGQATLRQIARRAHVGLGTLFNYAEDKRDLIFLIFNEELGQLTDEALALSVDGDVVTRLLSIYRHHYEYFGARPELSRILLQELTFYSSGKQSEAFLQTRRRLMKGIEDIVRQAQRDGKITGTEDASFIARNLFFVYSAAIRWWISNPRPKVAAGLEELRRVIELQMTGLTPAAPKRKRRD